MKASMIVSQLDPRGNIVHCLVLRGIHHSVDSLVLERGVERLCPSVVPAHPRTPHRRANTIGVEVVQEPLGRVLAAPVGVKDRHTLLDRTPLDRHVNGLAHQGGVHVVSHRITHNLFRAAVQNRRQIDESGPRPDIGGGTSRLRGNVPAQLLTGLICCEVPPEQVGPLIQVLSQHGGSDLCPWLRGLQPQVPHDGPDRGPIGPHATPLQDHLDSPVTVGAIGVLKNVLNHHGQLLPPNGRL